MTGRGSEHDAGAAPRDSPARDTLRSLIDYCSSLGGIFEVAVGTAASDARAVACGVSIYNDVLASRFTAVGSTPDEAAASVLAQIQRSASSAQRGGGSFRPCA